MRLTLLVSLLLAVVVAACGSEYEDPDALVRDTTAVDTTAALTGDNLFETLQADARFSVLTAAIDSAGLRSTFEGPGPLTLFAPTDAAFGALEEGTTDELMGSDNRDALRDLVMQHVINGRRMSSDLRTTQTAESMYGAELRIRSDDTSLRVGDATVTEADIEANNGVIHAIDSVLHPPDTI
jgi:uncharacterized surface protein with fasciclin (FAS1) repeats